MAADFSVAPGTTATLEAALEAARRTPGGPHRIVVAPGAYHLARPLALDTRDSGLTIEAAPGTAVLYGGQPLTGWQREGERFWSAPIGSERDFRALVVNGRLAERARLPETGTFLHQSVFDVPWLSSVGGGWARTPTAAELTTLVYDPKDIPPTLDVRNAELRIYHMWDESLVGTAANDVASHTLTYSNAAKSPAGAFGVKRYVVLNTREGMTHAGQWYLDRTAGRVVYWPLPGEDMSRILVVAPALERIIGITGTAQAPATGITLRGLVLQATSTPLAPGGFGAGVYDGALHMEHARDCLIEKLEIAAVGGQAVQALNVRGCRFLENHIHDTGACGLRAIGSDSRIAGNHIHHVGRYFPSAVAVMAHHEAREPGEGLHIVGNRIHDAPYSGIIASGTRQCIEENVVSAVMRELHDGAAIYGAMSQSVLRANVVRDVVKQGEGYGVSAFYLDEGATDTIVERNISIGVTRPTHNHIATRAVIRDNVFIADQDMTLSFQRSAGVIFTGNTLYVPGKLEIVRPNAIVQWADNLVYRDGRVTSAMPPIETPAPLEPVHAERLAAPPVIDGVLGWEEWPRTMHPLDREASRLAARGAPAFIRVGHDATHLYVAVNVAIFDVSRMLTGSQWGHDDGVEISLAGRVFRGYAGGAVEPSSTPVKFAARRFGSAMGGWRAEWAIPLAALGLKPAEGLRTAFNVTVYRAEDGATRMLDGTPGATLVF
jgi:hypothetical protein